MIRVENIDQPKPSKPRAAQKIIAGLREAIEIARGELEPARVTVFEGRRRGRPVKVDKAEPLVVEGVSKRTWYRRQKASK